MGQQRTPAGPWRLVEQLRDYLASTAWCDWLEVGGSLGRGAGDEHSDVDAGVGVHADMALARAGAAALRAVLTFAPVAGHLTQPFGRPDPGVSQAPVHHAVQYADGRQLNLVVMPASQRLGLPSGSIAVLDRGQRLQKPCSPALLTAAPDVVREWAFLAWWEIGDAVKHLGRGALWRSMTSLEDARRHAWQLYADTLGVDYPSFGAVSVENAGLPAPSWMAGTVPTRMGEAELRAAVRAMGAGLAELTADCLDCDVVGLRAVVSPRLQSTPDHADPSTASDGTTRPAQEPTVDRIAVGYGARAVTKPITQTSRPMPPSTKLR